MITRSATRAQTELCRTIEKQKRVERKQRLAFREEIETPYNLRSTMGKRGGNSSKGTGKQSKRGAASIGRDDVLPRTLFPVEEEGTTVNKRKVLSLLLLDS